MPLHIIKLCVGCDTPAELLDWRQTAFARGEPWILRTRQTPRRVEELLAGGSLYRVYRGVILSRQKILKVDTVGEGPASRCHVTLDEDVVLVTPTPRRAFQGWRYLTSADAPLDLPMVGVGEGLPPEFTRKLLEAGVW